MTLPGRTRFQSVWSGRIGAALRHQGVVVNGKKLHRLMREHALQPKQRRRYLAIPGGFVYLGRHSRRLVAHAT